MRDLIVIMENLLRAYERSTPSIDQGLVDRVQVCLGYARRRMADEQ